jgi:hypothetical protein
MNGAWPVYQRSAWLDLLAHYPASPEKQSDFISTLREVTNALIRIGRPGDELDPCLHGFKETAPLLRMGQKEGVGKLTPTAVATAGDLLNYGWEMTGLQMGARYHFVNARWGVPEQAKRILDTVVNEVQGLVPFFKNAAAANLYNYQECLFRLQHLNSVYSFVGWSPNPFRIRTAATNSNAITFMKRCWLRPSLFDWQARSLWDDNRIDLITELVDSVKDQEGPLGAVAALSYLSSIRQDLRGSLPKAEQWMETLADRLPQPTRLYINAVWHKKFDGMSMLETAQELERLYWQNPDSEIEDGVFLYYAKAGAFDAARRFYIESRPNLLDPVRTSNALGHYAYIVGYLKNDARLREMALQDSESSSYRDMLLRVWDAAVHDDREQLKEQIDELIERYESTQGPKSRGARMKQFLPLLPALANARNPKHKEAISYFGNEASWVMLRWIWIEKFKLSKDDAIAFLGGRETDAARHVLVCYLDGETEKTAQAADDLIHQDGSSPEQCILAKFLSAKLSHSKEPEIPDLKPADATSARAAVIARLMKK